MQTLSYSRSSAASGCGVPRGGGSGEAAAGLEGGESQVASGVLADAPPSDPTCSLDSLSENKIGDEGVAQLSATFPQLKALETLK